MATVTPSPYVPPHLAPVYVGWRQRKGTTTPALQNYQQGYTDGQAAGVVTGYAAGYADGYAQGFIDGVASAVPGTTPPIITIISPTPNAGAGTASGFPSNFEVAKYVPIVLDVTGVSADIRYICVVVRFFGGAMEEVVYRRGAFRGLYSGSLQTPHSNGVLLTTRRAGGWPKSINGQGDITFAVDPIDRVGNLTP